MRRKRSHSGVSVFPSRASSGRPPRGLPSGVLQDNRAWRKPRARAAWRIVVVYASRLKPGDLHKSARHIAKGRRKRGAGAAINAAADYKLAGVSSCKVAIKRRHKQKGDAVRSVARSVDMVNRKVTAAIQPPDNEVPRTTRSGLVPDEAVSNLGCTPCAIAGMANRRLFGRPGPSISLPSAANLIALGDLDESAFTPNLQMICVDRQDVERIAGTADIDPRPHSALRRAVAPPGR